MIAATQVIAANLVSTWTATGSQAGVASAIDPTQLVRAVQQARKTADTVVVYLHWGTEVQTCPNPQQEPLAQQLVNAGADIVIGSNAHVLSGGGYLGTAYVDYGLGNFAFYDNTAPETSSGSLVVTAVGRDITGATWRPAVILGGLPQPLTGTPAATAVASWQAARSCTNLAASPSASIGEANDETVPFVAPAATTTTTTTAASRSGGRPPPRPRCRATPAWPPPPRPGPPRRRPPPPTTPAADGLHGVEGRRTRFEGDTGGARREADGVVPATEHGHVEQFSP